MTWTRFSARTVRYDPLAGVFQPPGEATIRRVLEAVDAAALDAAVGSWLEAQLRAPDQGEGRGQQRRAVAVDGKSVRDARHASSDGQALQLLAAADQQAGAVCSPRRTWMARRMRSPSSRRCWSPWTW